MKVQGTLTVEGVKLYVRIDARDDEQELYVTNVHPNCLVIPKERWKVDYLGLPSEVVQELKNRGILFLGQLVDGKWNLGVSGFNEEMQAVISDALRKFLEIALVFDLPVKYQLGQLFTPQLAAVTQKLRVPDDGKPVLEQDISTIGLNKNQVDVLKNLKKVRTIGDLMELGRNRILMTPQMDARGIQKIEEALREYGLELPDNPQMPSQSAPVDSASM